MSDYACEPSYVCEPVRNHHDRTHFDCGVSVLNDYLAKYAKQDVKRKASAVFVLVARSDLKRIIGFYTLCATSVELSELPEEVTKKLPRYPEIPAILVGRLVRDINYPGVGDCCSPMLSHVVFVSQVKLLQARSLWTRRVMRQPAFTRSSVSSRCRNWQIECFFQCRRRRSFNLSHIQRDTLANH